LPQGKERGKGRKGGEKEKLRKGGKRWEKIPPNKFMVRVLDE